MLSRSDFWQFACNCYQRPGVQQALLALQDKAGKNVNLCLLLYYLDALGYTLEQELVKRLIDTAQAYDNQVLQPQRAIRQHLKAHHQDYHNYAAMRGALLNAELTLEQRQQDLLLTVLDQHSLPLKSQKNSTSNLHFYLSEAQTQQLLALL